MLTAPQLGKASSKLTSSGSSPAAKQRRQRDLVRVHEWATVDEGADAGPIPAQCIPTHEPAEGATMAAGASCTCEARIPECQVPRTSTTAAGNGAHATTASGLQLRQRRVTRRAAAAPVAITRSGGRNDKRIFLRHGVLDKVVTFWRARQLPTVVAVHANGLRRQLSSSSSSSSSSSR